jgi:hypothetical protein
MLGILIFFVPKNYVHRLLVKEKTNLLHYVQGRSSYLIREIIEIEHTKKGISGYELIAKLLLFKILEVK